MTSPPPRFHLDLADRRAMAPVLPEEVEDTSEGPRQWFGAYRWEAVRAVLGDDSLSSRLYLDVMGLGGRYGEILPGMDGEAHRQHRALLQGLLSRSAVTGNLRPGIGSAVDATLDRLDGLHERNGGVLDLMSEYCEPLPGLVLARAFALPDDTAPLLRAQCVVLEGDQARAAEVSDALWDTLRPVIRRRRLEPQAADLVSGLAHAIVVHRPLTDLEVFSHLRLLAIAGSDTVSRGLANLLFALLTHPDQLQAIRRDPDRAAQAVEEAMRWECPAVSVPRLVDHVTQVSGVHLPTGAAVRCNLAAANRDERRWSDADRFDIERPVRTNAAFGLGTHACLGAHLAHEVMEQAVLGLLACHPGLRLAPGDPPVMGGSDLRVPTHLRVEWS